MVVAVRIRDRAGEAEIALPCHHLDRAEPLDPRHQLIVLDVLKNQARAGRTVAAIMHDLTLAARFADEIILLNQGIIAASGTPETVLTEEGLAANFGIQAHVSHEDGHLVVVAERPLPETGQGGAGPGIK